MAKQPTRTPSIETVLHEQEFRPPAVDRTLSLLELLARSENGLTLSELCRKLSIPKSTAHYLIYTLVARGYLQRRSDGRHYSLGLRLADLANATLAEADLRTLAAPTLLQIAARTKLTATISVLRGAEAIIIGKAESFQDMGGGAWVGRHIDLHCTAQGKALIAFLSDGELDEMFRGRELAYFTPRTIRSLTTLKAHLAEVRANGFSVNLEENVVGVRAVAAPVTNHVGSVVAAVSIRGSTHQIQSFQLPQLGREIMLISREFSRQVSTV